MSTVLLYQSQKISEYEHLSFRYEEGKTVWTIRRSPNKLKENQPLCTVYQLKEQFNPEEKKKFS